MTRLLKKAFDEASKLSNQDQTALAALVLEELASERRWDDLLASSADTVASLADEVLSEHRRTFDSPQARSTTRSP